VTGLSLLLSPLAGGCHGAWGTVPVARGHGTTNRAKFLGGAALSLAYAIVRFIWASSSADWCSGYERSRAAEQRPIDPD
jgi:hypothetical protein